MNPQCLNLSDPQVKQYIKTYGTKGTYQIFVEHDYWLPDYQAYQNQKETDVIPQQQAMDYLQSLVDTQQFNIRDIQDIKHLLPQTTEAAFYRDAFYFGHQISRGAISEEAFHAVFQRLIPQTERAELYKIGQNLLKTTLSGKGGPANRFKSVREYYQDKLSNYPEIYGNLTEEEGYNRLYEEALAQDYVRYTTYGPLQQRLKPYSSNLSARLSPYLGHKSSQYRR